MPVVQESRTIITMMLLPVEGDIPFFRCNTIRREKMNNFVKMSFWTGL